MQQLTDSSPILHRHEDKDSGDLRKLYIAISVIVLVILSVPFIILAIYLIARIAVGIKYPMNREHIKWNWKAINVSDVHFPEDFLWGTATAAHQVEGDCTNNQWWKFEHSLIHGKSPIHNGDVSGKATDHWNLYPEDISLMKNELFVNAYRFSIEWSKVEPSKGVYNQTAIDHYHDEIDMLLDNGIVPMITLFHFTLPLWFDDIGGFELKENIHHFVNFSQFIFNEYSSKVNYWCTINEPNVYSLMGWSLGVFPPAKKDNALAGKVMSNLANAHVQVYEAIKELDTQNKSQVGIVINFQQFDPYRPGDSFDRMVASIMNDAFTGCYLNFFLTGVFRFYQPRVTEIIYENKKAMTSNDFFGLNYYSNDYVRFKANLQQPFIRKIPMHIKKTDMGWPIYPEGIYRAIKSVSKVGVPIIITENGIADAKDVNRASFIKRYLYAVSKAIKDGYNVKGFMYWSTMDNFEWAEGFSKRFGLYETDFTTFKRTLREGSKPFIDVVRRSRNL